MRAVVVLSALIVSLLAGELPAESWKAGVARAKITPEQPMWMSGYASRNHPSEGTLHDLWAKALVLEDTEGTRAVLVTLDLVGIDRGMSQRICQQIEKQYQLPRAAVALSTSHTHTGPVVGDNLRTMYFLSEEQQKLVSDYTRQLESTVVKIVGEALQSLQPASVSYGIGKATFAVNRRNNREPDVPMLREKGELVGPNDHQVPVLAVKSKDKLLAIVCGYACHATTLAFYEWSGDWPGFAQIELEKDHPGATVLFWAGCGADQNPLPRRTVELAQNYGHQMANAVNEVLKQPLTEVPPQLAREYAEIPLPFTKLPTREQLEEEAKASDIYHASRAKHLLKELDEQGKLAEMYPYPVQTWRLGPELAWVFLSGEVVVDFSLRVKQEWKEGTVFVAGYCNDVMAYIASVRVLREGGYEGVGAMVYYGLPTAWAESSEEMIVQEVHRQAKATVEQLQSSTAINLRGVAPAPAIRFRDVTQEANLLEPLVGIMGHGGAWGDVDGDGLLDLYVGGFADRPVEEYAPAQEIPANRLLRNLGNGKFEWIKGSPAQYFGRTSGAVFADLNNDGFSELYVANNAKPKSAAKSSGLAKESRLKFSTLFKNDKGTLQDVSQSSGTCPEDLETARNIGVFDYDADGLLDLLVLEDKFTQQPQSRLFRNRGNMKFEDVTFKVGLPEGLFGLGLAVADLNDDHLPDFFIGHSNRMFLSNGKGKYTEPEELKAVFAWKPLHGEDWPCGAAFGDLNRDGLLDLVLSIHCEVARNKVYLNRGLKEGIPQFEEVTAQTGLPESVAEKSPHVELQDFDNDGKLDLYLSTAWLDDKGEITPLIYRGTGNNKQGVPQFEQALTPPKHAKLVYFPAGPSADYDQDGQMDLFLINWFQGNHCRLLHNESPRQHWLQVEVVGKTFNRMGLGTRVSVYRDLKADPQSLLGMQEISIGYGYASGQPAVAHFGLGDVTGQVSVKLEFPDGREQVMRVPVDARLTFTEGE